MSIKREMRAAGCATAIANFADRCGRRIKSPSVSPDLKQSALFLNSLLTRSTHLKTFTMKSYKSFCVCENSFFLNFENIVHLPFM